MVKGGFTSSPRNLGPKQCPGRLLGILGQDPSVSKSNQLRVDIFQFFFMNLRYIP